MSRQLTTREVWDAGVESEDRGRTTVSSAGERGRGSFCEVEYHECARGADEISNPYVYRIRTTERPPHSSTQRARIA